MSPPAPLPLSVLRAVTPVVLVGGKSRRFGRDKLLEPWPPDGRPLVCRPIEALRQVFGARVCLVGTCDDRVKALGDRHVPDQTDGAGPMGGVATALRTLGPDVLAVAGDMPGITPATIASLLRSADAAPEADAVVAEQGGRLHPCLAIYRAGMLGPMLDALAGGERSLTRLLSGGGTPTAAGPRGLRVHRLPTDPGELRNVNHTTDAADSIGSVPRR